jgi:thioredoxin-dependent peroxiredoxin
MNERHGFVTWKGSPVTLVGEGVQVGERAPDFAALRSDLSRYSLAGDAGKVVVINSVLSVDTSICSGQARRFEQEAAALADDVHVLVISMDLPFTIGRFCAAEGIKRLTVLSDHGAAPFGTAYGLLVKEFRWLARAILVIGRDGALRYQQLVPEIAQDPDFEPALAAVREIAAR